MSPCQLDEQGRCGIVMLVSRVVTGKTLLSSAIIPSLGTLVYRLTKMDQTELGFWAWSFQSSPSQNPIIINEALGMSSLEFSFFGME